MILEARNYATDCHKSTNHLYDGKEYYVHLYLVYQTAEKFIHLVPAADRINVLAACWVHDVIEDCRQTYNDVKSATNEAIAELAYALTNEKGKNRKERASDKYYEGIRNTPNATFIKLCDRIANFEYSISFSSRMAEIYKKEYSDFKGKLYTPELKEMFDYLELIGSN